MKKKKLQEICKTGKLNPAIIWIPPKNIKISHNNRNTIKGDISL